MFKSGNKIIQILNNLQADQDQKRGFLLKLGKVRYSLFLLCELCRPVTRGGARGAYAPPPPPPTGPKGPHFDTQYPS